MYEIKTMTCECGTEIIYNNRYHCYDCRCGKCYNAVGSSIQPISNWSDEYDQEDY